jgi:sulfide:quinone oxidoreductase
MSQHVVILGAGFGGLELATQLSRSPDDVRVTLIDQSDSFVFGFEKLEVMFGRKSADDVRLFYRDFNKPGVEFRQQRVTSIDPQSRRVETDSDTYEPDFLVVALGADYDIDATPGFAEGGYEFYSLMGAERVSRVLPSVDKGTVVVAVLGTPFKCPPAPYEATFLLHDYLVQRGVRDAINLHMITPMPMPIPVSKDTSEAILRGLAERAIEQRHGDKVVRIDPAKKMAELASGDRLSYDLILGVPVHRVPAVVEASGLTVGGTDGWIHIDHRNLRTPFDGVYAIGDNADAPIPRAGVFAESGARIVAKDIAARIRGGDVPAFQGDGPCYIEFGRGTVAKVDVNFLGGPEPRAPFQAPTEDLAREKAAFAVEHRQRWFGLST